MDISKIRSHFRIVNPNEAEEIELYHEIDMIDNLDDPIQVPQDATDEDILNDQATLSQQSQTQTDPTRV